MFAGPAAGKPKNFSSPCSRKHSAATMRTMLRTWGDQFSQRVKREVIGCSDASGGLVTLRKAANPFRHPSQPKSLVSLPIVSSISKACLPCATRRATPCTPATMPRQPR